MSLYIQYNITSSSGYSSYTNTVTNLGSGGSSYDGALINGPAIITNVNSEYSSIAFNSQYKQYISIPSLNITNNGLSFSFWFNSNNNNNWARIFDFGNGPYSDNIIVFINNNYMGFCVYQGNIAYQKNNVIPNMNNNTRNHITWTISPTNGWIIYLNGKLFTTYEDGYYPNILLRNFCNIGKSNWESDPYFTGNIEDFRMYNSVLTSTNLMSIVNNPSNASVKSSSSDFTSKTTPTLVNGFNQLYNQIFCDLFQSTTYNGFVKCNDCNFSYSNSDNVVTTSPTGGEQECLNLCANNQYCTSYTFKGYDSGNTDSNNCTLYGLNNQYPIGINHNVNGNYSGYAVTTPKASYDYNNLNSDQQENVKLKCSNQYLNNVFTPKSPSIDISSCINFTTENNTSVFDTNPECVYNIYSQNGIPVNEINATNYTNSNKLNTGSTGDPNISNYQNTFNEYNRLKQQNSNINNQLSVNDNKNFSQYLSTVNNNYNTLSNSFLKNIDTQGNELIDLSAKINKSIGGNIEGFENKNNNTLLLLILLIFVLIFLFFVFKKK